MHRQLRRLDDVATPWRYFSIYSLQFYNSIQYTHPKKRTIFRFSVRKIIYSINNEGREKMICL
jgi:hypothetical protein